MSADRVNRVNVARVTKVAFWSAGAFLLLSFIDPLEYMHTPWSFTGTLQTVSSLTFLLGIAVGAFGLVLYWLSPYQVAIVGGSPTIEEIIVQKFSLWRLLLIAGIVFWFTLILPLALSGPNGPNLIEVLTFLLTLPLSVICLIMGMVIRKTIPNQALMVLKIPFIYGAITFALLVAGSTLLPGLFPSGS